MINKFRLIVFKVDDEKMFKSDSDVFEQSELMVEFTRSIIQMIS